MESDRIVLNSPWNGIPEEVAKDPSIRVFDFEWDWTIPPAVVLD